MMPAEFTIPGDPHGKGRPRATVVGGRARLYTPQKSADYEARVREIGARHFSAPLDCPVKIRIVAYFAMPKSWSKRKRAEQAGRHHTQKPDADNIMKSIKDGLNGVAWRDDCQAADCRIVKRWGDRAETFVQIGVAE